MQEIARSVKEITRSMQEITRSVREITKRLLGYPEGVTHSQDSCCLGRCSEQCVVFPSNSFELFEPLSQPPEPGPSL